MKKLEKKISKKIGLGDTRKLDDSLRKQIPVLHRQSLNLTISTRNHSDPRVSHRLSAMSSTKQRRLFPMVDTPFPAENPALVRVPVI